MTLRGFIGGDGRQIQGAIVLPRLGEARFFEAPEKLYWLDSLKQSGAEREPFILRETKNHAIIPRLFLRNALSTKTVALNKGKANDYRRVGKSC